MCYTNLRFTYILAIFTAASQRSMTTEESTVPTCHLPVTGLHGYWRGFQRTAQQSEVELGRWLVQPYCRTHRQGSPGRIQVTPVESERPPDIYIYR